MDFQVKYRPLAAFTRSVGGSGLSDRAALPDPPLSFGAKGCELFDAVRNVLALSEALGGTTHSDYG